MPAPSPEHQSPVWIGKENEVTNSAIPADVDPVLRPIGSLPGSLRVGNKIVDRALIANRPRDGIQKPRAPLYLDLDTTSAGHPPAVSGRQGNAKACLGCIKLGSAKLKRHFGLANGFDAQPRSPAWPRSSAAASCWAAILS